MREPTADGAMPRFPAYVEEELRLEGLEPLELAAVVFHEGKTLESGSYSCARRGPDGFLWGFEGKKRRIA